MRETTWYAVLQECAEDAGLPEVPCDLDTSRCRCEMCLDELKAEIKARGDDSINTALQRSEAAQNELRELRRGR